MARMLGRYEAPGCCPGCRAGWYRRRRGYGPDCSGGATNKRWRKRVEQREFVRSLLPTGEIEVSADVIRDCVHGCDGECELYGGNGECTFVCHPGRLLAPADEVFTELGP